MNFEKIANRALTLRRELGFIAEITDKIEYEKALAFMDYLIEDYAKNKPTIELLSNAIERWEDSAEEFTEFNASLNALDEGTAMLNVLMDQHGLKAKDLKNEIGGKSAVSMISNGTRKLTVEQIQALSNRFNVSPARFFKNRL